MSREEHFLDAALLRTMTLLSALNVAAELAFDMRERKAGRDPSADNEDTLVWPELADDCALLRTLSFQLESSSALTTLVDTADNDQRQAFSVQRYIDLVRLQKTSQRLHRIHQHLLSLYPAVDESVVEEARLLEATCEAVRNADTEGYAEALLPFLQQLKSFIRLIGAHPNR